MSRTKRSSFITIVRLPWWYSPTAWIMAAVSAWVTYAGYYDQLSRGKNTIGVVLGVLGLAIVLPPAVGSTISRGRILVGRRDELVTYRLWPLPGRDRLVGDLRDVAMVSPELPLPDIERHGLQPLSKERFVPHYTQTKMVLAGTAGSIEARLSLELVNPDFVQRFRDWQRLQHGVGAGSIADR